jgi:hypothetical protein
MKALVILLLFSPLIACHIQADPRDAKIADLERRVSTLENSAKSSAQEESHRRVMLESCLKDADVWYNENLRLNATSTRKESFSVPVAAMQQASNVKRDKIEQCKLLWAH